MLAAAQAAGVRRFVAQRYAGLLYARVGGARRGRGVQIGLKPDPPTDRSYIKRFCE